jgi:hypothetical protein
MTGGGFRPCATNNGQFDKLTDRTEGAPAPELKGQFDGFGWLTAGKLTDRTARELGSLSLSKGPQRFRHLCAFVTFAYAEVHSWHLISMDSTLSRE